MTFLCFNRNSYDYVNEDITKLMKHIPHCDLCNFVLHANCKYSMKMLHHNLHLAPRAFRCLVSVMLCLPLRILAAAAAVAAAAAAAASVTLPHSSTLLSLLHFPSLVPSPWLPGTPPNLFLSIFPSLLSSFFFVQPSLSWSSSPDLRTCFLELVLPM